MSIYINNVSAMKFYCQIASSLDEETQPSAITSARDSSARARDIRELANEREIDLGLLRTKSGKIHVLVDDLAKHWESASIERHRIPRH